MASLERRADRFRVVFRYAGRKFQHPLRTGEEREALSCLHRLEENLRLLERGRLELPAGADLPTFLLSDGKLNDKPQAPEVVSYADLRDRYLAAHSQGAMEDNSLDTVKMHLRHFEQSLGTTFPMPSLRLGHLQEHVERRSKAKGIRKRPLSPTTLRKEVASLRAAWNWAVQAGLVASAFPNRGLKYPKASDKPPFQTWQEITRQIERGGLSPADERELWDCLFLTLPEIDELLALVRQSARHPFLHPMFSFAAHTGARRSEMLRLRISDIDFGSETVLLHEKKRVRGKRSFRRVPLSPQLVEALKGWLAVHPGGQYVFCHRLEVVRSRKERKQCGPLTRNEANDQFKRTLGSSRWEKLRGWHVFRHSFASNCAAKGVDQRMIDSWMGHQTEEMRRRYRHLFPDQEQAAIRSVFAAQAP